MGDRRQPGGGKAPRRHSVRPRVARPDSWNAKCLISTSPPKLSPPASLSPPPPPSPSPAGLVLLPPPPARSCSPGADQVTTPNRTTHLTPPGPFLAPFPLPHFWINNLPSLPISFSLSSCRRQRGRSAQHIVPSEYVVRRRKVNLAGVRIRCTTLSQPLVKIVCVAPRLPTDRKPMLSKHANCSAPNGPDRPSFKGHLQSRALSSLPASLPLPSLAHRMCMSAPQQSARRSRRQCSGGGVSMIYSECACYSERRLMALPGFTSLH